MASKLRAVGPDEKPAATPKSLADAVGMSRMDLLVRARLELAKTIDGGVPPHALGRLITDMERLDAEIRRLAVLDGEGGGVAQATDGTFDAAAI